MGGILSPDPPKIEDPGPTDAEIAAQRRAKQRQAAERKRLAKEAAEQKAALAYEEAAQARGLRGRRALLSGSPTGYPSTSLLA